MGRKSAQTTDYANWLAALKQQFRQTQLKAAVQINSELLNYYWHLGDEIVEKQQNSSWGDKFLAQLSQDLMAGFPDIKGFSRRNLEQIRRWYRFWQQDSAITKQAATQLVQIPWWYNVVIVSKCQSQAEAISNFEQTLPDTQSDLVQQAPYVFQAPSCGRDRGRVCQEVGR
ncbi:MAG: hypothetical protein COB33_002735 [Thiotrichaceae bacterium]|nr:hypothetical protein [Thiotrichaceae bacterium]PCI14063.1 MAG: hypothetical protein COB71_03680 [Thiotrichales bacterium]